MSSAKRKFVIVLPPVTVPTWSSSASAIILSKKMLKRVGESRHPWRTLVVVRNHSPFFVVMVDCAGRLVVETFNGSDQVVIDVIQPHVCPQSCMPKRLLEIYKDMVKALLVLQVFLTEYSENLLSCAPSCSEACLFFFDDLLSLTNVASVYSGRFLA